MDNIIWLLFAMEDLIALINLTCCVTLNGFYNYLVSSYVKTTMFLSAG